MAIICAICTDTINFSNSCCTRCGHVFHHNCLLEWLRRSKTCPQCREIVNRKQLYKIYFNSDDIASDNSCSLQRIIQNQEIHIRKLEASATEREMQLRLIENSWYKHITTENERIRYLERRLVDSVVEITKLRQRIYLVQDIAVRGILHVICNCFSDFTISMSMR